MWPWRLGVVVENDRCDRADMRTAWVMLRLFVENLEANVAAEAACPCCTRRQAVVGTVVARRDTSVLEAGDIFNAMRARSAAEI